MSFALPCVAQEIYVPVRKKGYNELFARPGHPDQIPKDGEGYAALFFENCVKQPSERALPDDLREELCGCSAEKMQNTLTEEEAALLFTDEKDGAFQKLRMGALAVIPCMERPVAKLYYAGCLEDTQRKREWKNHETVCACVSVGLGEFVTTLGDVRDFSRNLTVDEILSSFMEGAAFRSQEKSLRQKCVWSKEYGW